MQVAIQLLTALLLGNVWYRAGQTAVTDDVRAKRLVARKKATILGPAEDFADLAAAAPMPDFGDVEHDPAVVGSGPLPVKNTKRQSGTPLETAGIAGKAADLLRGAGLGDVETLRSAIESGRDLTEINGIGPSTVKTIRAAIAVKEG